MFDKILIANRSEIACRIIRTARRLGVLSVAVCSEADAEALHVALADESVLIGPAPARQSYLAIDRILDAARRTGAEAIHPGYGFLSENAAFAEACAAAGIVFIGPPPSAIRAMGSKAAAKTLMEAAGVPVVPGYHGDAQDAATLHAAASRIGFPLLIKACAGGGGKGMRIVAQPAALDDALALVRGEAAAAFGDDRVLLERYLPSPRHIEIQVFADMHDNIVHMFERDCSIQRRHQKVVEEAPAPSMSAAQRRLMGDAACAAARAVGYVGAGTVEFIAAGEAFYFMEMNTRLQVEHPVTEAITGQDLVEWQLRVAAGEMLPLSQDALGIEGHAIEVRVYAEDPARDFVPSVGTLHHLRAPAERTGVRVDAGVREGDAIGVHYDPMIAKLIVHGADRAATVQRLRQALSEYEIGGVRSNLALLRAIAVHPAFAAGAVDTGFILQHSPTLLAPPLPPSAAVLAAAVHVRLRALGAALRATVGEGDPWSPWYEMTAWRLNGDGWQDFLVRIGEREQVLRAHLRADGGFRLDLPQGTAEVAVAALDDGMLTVRLDGAGTKLRAVTRGDVVWVFHDGAAHELLFLDPLAAAGGAETGGGRVLAPMPGRVLEILVAEGDNVARGAVLLVLEAMKVQMRLAAPADGVVAALHCRVGDLVQDGSELVSLAPAP
jgi:3-methylcrotonyl-CoA carboxylase alpha subunit